MRYVNSYGYLAISGLLYWLFLQLLYQPNLLQNQFPTLSEDLLLLIKGFLFCVCLIGSWLISDEAFKNF